MGTGSGLACNTKTWLSRDSEGAHGSPVTVVEVSRRSDKKAASREYFGRHAADYETHHRWRNVREPQGEALAMLELSSDDRLLDVGCGTGVTVREAAPLVSRAVGVDLSPEMIDEARRLARDLPSAEFVVGDSESLPFADGEFTVVLCTTSIHHYPDPGKAVAEMARVLASGGRLAIGDANRGRLFAKVLDRLLRRLQRSHARILSSAELSGYVGAAGLSQAGFRRLRRGGYVIFLARK